MSPIEIPMKISVIIVNWNTREVTSAAIASVFAETKVPLEVIVVDNGSSDGSADFLRERHRLATLIETGRNGGFSFGNNIGLAAAKGEYLMLLNSDTLVRDGALDRMAAFLDENPSYGLVGPRLTFPDGKFQETSCRNLPRLANSFFYLLGLERLRMAFGGAPYRAACADPLASQDAEALSGAAIMLRRSVYEKIGGLDERFFMYGEDLDFCKRAHDAGFGIRYLGDAHIVHLGGESSAKRKSASIGNFYDAARLYYEKHEAPGHAVPVNLAVRIGIGIVRASALVRNLFR